jgi:hypothetical protein
VNSEIVRANCMSEIDRLLPATPPAIAEMSRTVIAPEWLMGRLTVPGGCIRGVSGVCLTVSPPFVYCLREIEITQFLVFLANSPSQ